MNEYKTLSKEPWTHIELVNDNVFHWKVALIVLNPTSVYYGGYFLANLSFPSNYPYSPPGKSHELVWKARQKAKTGEQISNSRTHSSTQMSILMVDYAYPSYTHPVTTRCPASQRP